MSIIGCCCVTVLCRQTIAVHIKHSCQGDSLTLTNYSCRTIYRLYQQGRGGAENREKTIRRWLTFKNIYVLTNNLIFLTALILRYLAFAQDECRTGCPYEGNKTAFIGACLWAIGALMTFLRNVQVSRCSKRAMKFS